jgi:hypothetical protein
MRRFCTLFLATWALWIAPVSFAQEAIPPEYEALVREGHAKLEAGRYEAAAIDFHNALGKLPDPYFYNPPPELIYNMALALDKAPGHLLASALWYKAYLQLAPNDPKAPEIRHISDTLLSRFDQYVLDAATVLESSYDEMKLEIQARGRVASAPESEANQDFRRQVENDRKLLPDMLANIESARIAVGDVETALKMLNRYGMTDQPNENLSYYLTAIGRLDKAGRYAARKSDGEVLAEMGWLASSEITKYDSTDKDLIQIMLEHGAVTEAEASGILRGKANLKLQMVALAALKPNGKGKNESQPQADSIFDNLRLAETKTVLEDARSSYRSNCREGQPAKAYIRLALHAANRSYQSRIYADRTPVDDPAALVKLKPTIWILTDDFSNYANQLQLLAFYRQLLTMVEDVCK